MFPRPGRVIFERTRIPVVGRMAGGAVFHDFGNDLDRLRKFFHLEHELYPPQ